MHYNGFYPNDFIIYDLSVLAGNTVSKQYFFEEGRLNTDRFLFHCQCNNSPDFSSSIVCHLFLKVNSRTLDFNSRHLLFLRFLSKHFPVKRLILIGYVNANICTGFFKRIIIIVCT